MQHKLLEWKQLQSQFGEGDFILDGPALSFRQVS